MIEILRSFFPDESRVIRRDFAKRASLLLLGLVISLGALSPRAAAMASSPSDLEIVISIRNQTMTLVQGKAHKAEYPVSTSKFGVGNTTRSFRTPLGIFRIERKVGSRLPLGAVFKGLRFTGEVVAPNSPGRDPIVTRVLCLRGVDGTNENAGNRGIYIHGTPEESTIGKPASYGCIRMRSRDVITLFDSVEVGTRVVIMDPPATNNTRPSGGTRDADWYR